MSGRLLVAPGVLMFMVAASGCTADAMDATPTPPEWTWVDTRDHGYDGLLIEAAGEDQLVVVHTGYEDARIEMQGGDGRTLWTQMMDSVEGQVSPRSVAVGDDGMIYVGGIFSGTASFDDDGTTVSSPCEFCTQGFVAAYGGDGEMQWLWRCVEESYCWIYSIAAVPSGVALIGEMARPSDDEPATSKVGPPPQGWFLFTLGLDQDGQEAWLRREPSVVDPVSGEHTPGHVQEIATGDDGTLRLLVRYTVNEPEKIRTFYKLFKLSENGEEVWQRDVDGGRLVVTDDGDTIVVGHFNSASVEQVDFYYLYVRRYDGSTGELLWSSFLGDWRGGWMYVNDVELDPAGDLYILGWLREPGPVTVGPSTLDVTGFSELFVTRLRGDDGTAVAASTSGIPGSDSGVSLIALAPDDVIVAGNFYRGELQVDGEVYVAPNLGVFVRRGDPFVSPPPFAPRGPQW